MGIQINFNTEDLTEEDIAVLTAISRSLADPEWPNENKPKRPAGRPRMTDEEKAEAAAKRAAEKAEKEKAAKDEAERLATEKAAAVTEEPEEAPEEPAKAPAKAKPAEPKKEPEKAAEKAPEPEKVEKVEEPTPAAAESDEDGKSEAVRLATKLVQDGRGTEVRNALKEVGAKKVSDLDGKSLDGFLAIAREL